VGLHSAKEGGSSVHASNKRGAAIVLLIRVLFCGWFLSVLAMSMSGPDSLTNDQ
jgi:hypothetical protein